MQRGDVFVSEINEKKEYGITFGTHNCGLGESGKWALSRVINKAGEPYSVIFCKNCGYEIYSTVTPNEKRMVNYAKGELCNEQVRHRRRNHP
jgi:hypothetical protein